MTSRPYKARSALILNLCALFSILLAACQSSTSVPTLTQEPTASGRTPVPRITLETTNTPEPTQEPVPTLAPHVEVEGSALDGVNVDFWHPWQADLAQRAAEAADQFNRENEWGINVRVRSLYSSGALLDSLVEMQQAGAPAGEDSPEVIAVLSDQLSILSAGEKGPVDLESYINHPDWGLSEGEVAAYNPAFWGQDVQDGKRLGIPALRNATVLFYNRGWAQELGFQNPPKSAEEFRQQACAAAVANNQLTQQEKHGTGGYLVDMSPVTALSWLAAFGAQPIPEQAGQPFAFESEAGEEALSFLRGMFDNGCAWVGRKPEPFDYFAQRMALFYSGTLSDVFVQKRVLENHANGDQWQILPFPGSDGSPVVYASGHSYAVLPAGNEQQMAAWLFVRWMSQPGTQAKLGETLPSIPVSSAVVSQLSDYQAHFPWDGIFPLAENVRPTPASAAWRVARRVLEDAFRQVFYLPADQVETVLPMIDETIQELQGRDMQE